MSRACVERSPLSTRSRSRVKGTSTLGCMPASITITSAPSPSRLDQPERGALGLHEARGRDVGGLHGGRAVHDDDHPLGAVPHHGHRRPRQRQSEGEQGEDLQEDEGVALQPLEEGRGLAVAERRVPEEQARHRLRPPAHLQEVQEQQRHGEAREQERERREEAHATRKPLSCRSMNSSTGVSVTTRW